MIRKEIIKKYVETEGIHHIIGHNGSILIKEVLKTLLFLFVLYVIYTLISNNSQREYRSWIAAIIGIYLFIKFVITFLNIYLDCLLLTERGITLFMREGIRDHKTDVFERDKIQTISFHQNSFWDKLFARGDLMIRLDRGVDFPFDDISYPKKQVEKIVKMKDYFIDKRMGQDLEEAQGEENKFNILVEALGEVVQDYMDKKDGKSNFDNNY